MGVAAVREMDVVFNKFLLEEFSMGVRLVCAGMDCRMDYARDSLERNWSAASSLDGRMPLGVIFTEQCFVGSLCCTLYRYEYALPCMGLNESEDRTVAGYEWFITPSL